MEIKINSPKYGEKIILIDDEDAELINKYTWHIANSRGIFYVTSYAKMSLGGNAKSFKLHRMLMGFPDCVDHINGNALDNRKTNLRIVTQRQNSMNRSMSKNNSTGFKGVNFIPEKNKFRARVGVMYKKIEGGLFDTAIEAAKRYNELALIHHGEFANLNQI